ncbi:MAG: M42 family metallopeptidase [Clostridiales bacterium]|nr:M42 family metallopeptidase [Clostridiales bacterium]
MFDLIKQMADLYGATGREAGVADAIEALMKDKADTITRDALGNLICEKKGTDPNGKRIMLSAHMDHIGFVVVAVEKEGFLRVMPVGGINLAVSRTRHIYFSNGVQGVISQEPVPAGETPAMKHMFVDIGAESKEEALSMIELGDVAVYSNDCFRLGKNRVSAPAMDDRVACALLISVMQALPQTKNTVIAVFSTQEEVGCRGAKTAAYSVQPDIGIALDVTGNGDTPETKQPAVKLGDGAAVKIMDRGSISNPELVTELLAAGKRAGVKTQREVLPYGGTDASTIQLSRGGVVAGTISIPCRYVHSACEVIDLRDVEAAKGLLLNYLQA